MDNGNHAGGSGNGGSEQPTPACFRDMEITKIMRRSLPSHAEISDDFKQSMQRCVSEFICFVTCAANERCQNEQRVTVTAEDMLWVMSKFGFDAYIEPLTLYLRLYREDGGGERESLREERLLKRPMENGDMQGDASNGSTSQ